MKILEDMTDEDLLELKKKIYVDLDNVFNEIHRREDKKNLLLKWI